MSEGPAGQGEIWTVTAKVANIEREHTVVVLTTAAVILQDGPVTVAMVKPGREILEKRRLLTVAIPGTSDVVAVYNMVAFPAAWFTRRQGVLPPDSLASVRSALKSYFDLHD
ncbi:MAG: hypothetical protein JWN03_291 [Nocardia sp.]|uniref:hypothetical protein n=1 Tax=Nocardia sp. TaxID=1821 RepID=UPI00261E1775|nr:hypothetical protein [Nocardia sp.]MCU1640016.1 hypothetical protein [Nocardia sp.]